MNDHLLPLLCTAWMTLLFGVNSVSIPTSRAQILVEVPLHDFKDRSGVPLVCGEVVAYNNKAINVRDGLQTDHVLISKELSREDQRFILALKKANKAAVKKETEALALFDDLESGSTKNELKNLEKIANIGPVATSLSEDIAKFGMHTEDDLIAAACLQTFVSICQREPRTAEVILKFLNSRPGMLMILERDPTLFFDGLVRTGPYGERVLIIAAFTGEMIFDLKKDPAKPALLPTTNGPKNKIRAAAGFALSQINTVKAKNAVFAVCKSAEAPINGQIDSQTISQILLGCAKSGYSVFGMSAEVIKRNEARFPREVAVWREANKAGSKLAANRSKLLALSRLRRFFDASGDFMFRGKFESYSDGLVLITDENKQRLAIPASKFSDDDKKWILQQSKKK